MEKLSKVEEKIREHTTNYVAQRIYNDKLDKSFMFVFYPKSHREVVVYDEEANCKEIARVTYNMNGKGTYVSELLVDEEYQQLGFGKFLFSVVIEHSKNLGSKMVYGCASPIDNIKGVSNQGGDDEFEKEKEIVKLIYQKLGCSVEKKYGDYEFSIKVDNNIISNKNVKNFVSKIMEKEEEKSK